MPKMAWRLSILGVVALIAGAAAPAGAQSPPVRVIQGADGSLYIVQGTEAWVLVPDAASDDDVAALDLRGEVDGTLPSEILPAPAVPPAAPVLPDAPAEAAPSAPSGAPAKGSASGPPPTPTTATSTNPARPVRIAPTPVSAATSTPSAPGTGARR